MKNSLVAFARPSSVVFQREELDGRIEESVDIWTLKLVCTVKNIVTNRREEKWVEARAERSLRKYFFFFFFNKK